MTDKPKFYLVSEEQLEEFERWISELGGYKNGLDEMSLDSLGARCRKIEVPRHIVDLPIFDILREHKK